MSDLIKPDDIVGVSFWLMTLAMFGLAAFVFLERRRLPEAWQMPVTAMGVVGLIAGLNYLVITAVWAETGAASTVYRFIDWQLTVPIKVIVFYLLLNAVTKVHPALFWRLLVSSAIMIAAGYLGAAGYISPTLGFLVALAGGLYVLGELYLGEAARVSADSGNDTAQTAFNALRLIATIGWAIYPLGYFMEFLSGGVDSASINLIYNLVDFLNVVAFGLVVHWAATKDRASSHRRAGI